MVDLVTLLFRLVCGKYSVNFLDLVFEVRCSNINLPPNLCNFLKMGRLVYRISCAC